MAETLLVVVPSPFLTATFENLNVDISGLSTWSPP